MHRGRLTACGLTTSKRKRLFGEGLFRIHTPLANESPFPSVKVPSEYGLHGRAVMVPASHSRRLEAACPMLWGQE